MYETISVKRRLVPLLKISNCWSQLAQSAHNSYQPVQIAHNLFQIVQSTHNSCKTAQSTHKSCQPVQSKHNSCSFLSHGCQFPINFGFTMLMVKVTVTFIIDSHYVNIVPSVTIMSVWLGPVFFKLHTDICHVE